MFMSLRHFPAYLNQRFPPLAVMLFVVLYLTVSFVANTKGGEPPEWSLFHVLGAVSCISFFFRLRVMDEIKDLKTDREVHPERLVVQGKIKIRELMLLAVPGTLLEIYWSWSASALDEWLLVFGYSLLMRYEFFVSRWLEKRLLLYAFSHLLIMPLVVLWLWKANYPWDILFLETEKKTLAAIAFFAASAFEIARKIYASKEEPPKIPTYSKILGRSGASWLTMLLLTINYLFLVFLFHSLELQMTVLVFPVFLLMASAFVYRKALKEDKEKQFRLAEKLVSSTMLVNYLLLIVWIAKS